MEDEGTRIERNWFYNLEFLSDIVRWMDIMYIYSKDSVGIFKHSDSSF